MTRNLPAQRGAALEPTVVGPTTAALPDRRTNRALVEVERGTLVRLASVRAHTMVQVEKTHEIDRLAREAMSGQAMLSHWAATLAQGDAFVADELKIYTDLARVGKAEIISETISDFCQEGR